MKTPTFAETRITGLLSTSENLKDSMFKEYRETKAFKNVLEVKIRSYGVETRWTKEHDYVIVRYFTLDSGNCPHISEVENLIRLWNRSYPGIHNYEIVKEKVLDFVI